LKKFLASAFHLTHALAVGCFARNPDVQAQEEHWSSLRDWEGFCVVAISWIFVARSIRCAHGNSALIWRHINCHSSTSQGGYHFVRPQSIPVQPNLRNLQMDRPNSSNKHASEACQRCRQLKKKCVRGDGTKCGRCIKAAKRAGLDKVICEFNGVDGRRTPRTRGERA